MLKAIYEKQDEIPENYRDLFEERGGQWILSQVEGVKTDADIARLERAASQERDAHRQTKEKLDGFKKYSDLGELDEVQEKLDRLEELEAQAEAAGDREDKAKGGSAAQIEAARQRREMERETRKLRREIEAEREERKTEQEELASFRRQRDESRIVEAAMKVARARKVPLDEVELDVRDAVLRHLSLDGDDVVTRDGKQDVEAWFEDELRRRPSWNPTSRGGGGRGSGGEGLGENPWTDSGWNMTKQGQIVREDPKRAERMAAAAGTTVGGRRPTPKKA